MFQYLMIGFVLASVITPLISIFIETIEGLGELIKAAISVRIVQHNVRIAEINKSLEEVPSTHAIGFTIPDEEEDFDDEE